MRLTRLLAKYPRPLLSCRTPGVKRSDERQDLYVRPIRWNKSVWPGSLPMLDKRESGQSSSNAAAADSKLLT